VQLGSTNAYSHYRAAQLSWKPEPDAAYLAAQRQQLERAIELNASAANAHSFLAEVIVAQGDGKAASRLPSVRSASSQARPITGSLSRACASPARTRR
jgi:hypothetical protein